ncbi:MAG: hypothetical protein BWY77_01829 [bacterium ADurb.Bin431]|nr:MAG: hypothetical protein BWY77_01829 [bacterium ADurb.Bin431]
MDADERAVGEVEERALNDLPANRIGAVEDHKGDALLGRRLEAVKEGADVGIKTGADILDVEDQHLHIREHLRGGLVVFAVEAVDRDPGAGILFVIEQGARLQAAAHSVLRAEEGDQLQIAGLREQVGGMAAVAGDSGVVGDQSDPLASQGFEAVADEKVQTGKDPALLPAVSAVDQGQCSDDQDFFHHLSFPEGGLAAWLKDSRLPPRRAARAGDRR